MCLQVYYTCKTHVIHMYLATYNAPINVFPQPLWEDPRDLDFGGHTYCLSHP